MSTQSSAKFVSYNLRPSKQCERKMILDSFNAAMECGLPIPNYRYVGMGGNSFYDFIMMHKMIGITNMVSLEHDVNMISRAKFNCPFKFIEVLNSEPHEFVSSDNYLGKSIYWMDFDSSLNPKIVRDIGSIAMKMKLDEFLFVTVCGVPPKFLDKLNMQDRLTEIQEKFQDFAISFTKHDMQNKKFASTVVKILNTSFTNVFVQKNEGIFFPFFQVRYIDGLEMVTIGGIFASEDKCLQLKSCLQKKIPVLTDCAKKEYKITRFNFTDKERHLFDVAATSKRKNVKEIGQLKNLGFDREEIERYKALLRYFPRYVETFI